MPGTGTEGGRQVTETAQGASGATATAVRTFLIADVRGYTQFTLKHGRDP